MFSRMTTPPSTKEIQLKQRNYGKALSSLMKSSVALAALSLSVIVPATVSPSAYIDKPEISLQEDVELILPAVAIPTIVKTLGPKPVVETKVAYSMVGLVDQKAREHGVPEPLAQAVISIESGYRPNVLSKGNYGLGQIRCGTARGVGFQGDCRDLLKPEVNLDYTMRYLRRALDQTNDDWCKAATIYNGGGARNSSYCRKVLARVDKPVDKPL
jgi:soluble lytic murein transglycosylase-like protein